MRILVTGANGYIGRHVVMALLDKGIDVIACDINCSNVDKRAKLCSLNIFNLPEGNIWEQLGMPDICLHMAWRNGFIHNAKTHMSDISSHYNFMTSMIDGGLKHLVVMGSMHEVGYWEGVIDENTPCNPISMYGIAKDALRRSMIQYTAQNNCILQWLRCYYILGDDRRNNSIFCKLLTASDQGLKTFPFTSGKNKYDFIEVNELAQIISCVVNQNEVTGIINCCSGEPVSLGEQVENFIKEHSLDIKLDYGAFPDRPYDSPCVYGDVAKISKILNYNKEKENVK